MKKKLILCIVMIATLLIFSACGKTQAPPSESADAAVAATVTEALMDAVAATEAPSSSSTGLLVIDSCNHFVEVGVIAEITNATP